MGTSAALGNINGTLYSSSFPMLWRPNMHLLCKGGTDHVARREIYNLEAPCTSQRSIQRANTKLTALHHAVKLVNHEQRWNLLKLTSEIDDL